MAPPRPSALRGWREAREHLRVTEHRCDDSMRSKSALVGGVGRNFRKRIRRFFAGIDDADQRPLIVKNLEDFVEHAMRTEAADTADSAGMRCGCFYVHGWCSGPHAGSVVKRRKCTM